MTMVIKNNEKNPGCSKSFVQVWNHWKRIYSSLRYQVEVKRRLAFESYEVHTISFQTFGVWSSKIVVDFRNFSMLLLYILWHNWSIFMISGSKEQLQQQLEYTLLKPDCHCWWISKMQSDTLEERYAIKFCFKLEKKCHRNLWNAPDCFWSILNESSISFWVA